MATVLQNYTTMSAMAGFSVAATGKFNQTSNGAASPTALVQAMALVDPANPTVPITSFGGGNAAAGLTGSPVPTSGGYTAYKDGSGNLVGVSAATPLPVTTATDTPTYMTCVTPGLTTGGTAVQMQGTASKVIRIRRIEISGTLTTAAVGYVGLYRGSTAASGGTPTTATVVKMDPNNATSAMASLITSYAGVNPTAGTQVLFDATRVLFDTTISQTNPFVRDFGLTGAQSLVLRGASDFINIGLITFAAAAFAAGLICAANIYWTEE